MIYSIHRTYLSIVVSYVCFLSIYLAESGGYDDSFEVSQSQDVKAPTAASAQTTKQPTSSSSGTFPVDLSIYHSPFVRQKGHILARCI